MTLNIKEFSDKAFKDTRGLYWTSWKREMSNLNFKHDKFSLSRKNVLRGLHGDNKTWKLVSCVYGKVFFVIINYDRTSKNFLNKKTTTLSHLKVRQILIPPKYLNGFLCLSDECVFHYKLSYSGNYADVRDQFSVKWNDPRLNIKWPVKNPILSKRDRASNFVKKDRKINL
tara:strand:+ start:362 stop:874 length:513 start_codon:yes stop_codon:yes gene_type:complete